MITIERTKLIEKLNILEKAYSSKTTIPALQFIKFDNGKMTMSDSNVVIITRIDIAKLNDEEDFKALIPFKLFKDIISKLNNEDIELNLKDNVIEINSYNSHYTLNTMDFTEYPNISINKLENTLKINSNDLKRIIKNTIFACSTNDKKPVLTGVNFNVSNGLLNLVATDSFRLSKIIIDNFENNDLNLTIQAKDLNNILKLIPNDTVLEIIYSNNEIVFNFGYALYKTRLLEGNYPDISRIIPNFYNYHCNVDREILKEIIDRVSVFSPVEKDLSYSVVSINFKKNGTIEITCDNSQLGKAKETINCDCDFDLSICCSSQYLIDALNVFDTNKIDINLNGDLKPFTITSNNDSNNIQVLLPIKNN